MTFFVLGYDPNGTVLLLTRRGFLSRQDAEDYAATCNPLYRAFVVQMVDVQ
ncbi:hypothetical protein [Xylophilus sp.]|uniref:hypothetical protein n=1 Tax=Xylophilus sp. TaxID=2653893 RepID=UPI0013B90ED3|nr:hypothetical protein [Xylophilus sp.]KAF1049306.1 MAG: hypothetical protein GAK38_00762 [Xylophilus sp.]